MLVYVFWHWPDAATAYETGLVAFHRRLAEVAPPGFVQSAAYRVGRLPWQLEGRGTAEGDSEHSPERQSETLPSRSKPLPLGAGEGGAGHSPETSSETYYEDWYLVESFAALGVLNDTAVAPSMRADHDRPARAAAGGAGGLYAVRAGTPDLDAPELSWFGKPRGQSYAELFSQLPPIPALLQRQLVLGPAFEFCAMSRLPGIRPEHRIRLC